MSNVELRANVTAMGSVHSRTAILLIFSVRLPSVGATGRWKESREGWRRRANRVD